MSRASERRAANSANRAIGRIFGQNSHRDQTPQERETPCEVCGILNGKHVDGWDGNWLNCEEAARRGGRPVLKASDLRRLAQYLLAAAVQLQQGKLSPDALSLLREWTKAEDHLRRILLEFDGSTAATVAKRAIGMLTRRQLAQDEAAAECAALLTLDESLKNALADGRWEEVGEQIAWVVIQRYLSALERGQA